ncbi:MAG: hypothetical protein EOO75_04335, partial [Myxococcales bacterium]
MPRPVSAALVLVLLLTGGCTRLHAVQIGDIDNTLPAAQPIEAKQSETGLDVAEAAGIARAVGGKGVDRAANGVESVWKLITFGPKTGNVVFADDYADQILLRLQQACPGGLLSDLMTIRESNKYPVVSGEIVRVRAYCTPLAADDG